MSEQALLSIDEILAALTFDTSEVPAEALRQARDRWPEIADRFLDLLRRATGEMSDAEADAVGYGIYLAAQARDARAYPLLCALARHPTRLEELIGDGVTEDIEALFVRLFDGDVAPLKALIEDEGAYEFVREGALYALAWLTAEGRVPRETMRDYLAWLFDHLRPQRGANYVWIGWQSAVAALGFAEFTPQVMQLYKDGRISKRDISPGEFREDLAKAQAVSEPLAAFETHIGPRIDQLDDLIAFMGTWASFQPGYDDGKDGDDDLLPPSTASRLTSNDGVYINPYRHVGRNDPCPCGSGKKFKKCCLGIVGGG